MRTLILYLAAAAPHVAPQFPGHQVPQQKQHPHMRPRGFFPPQRGPRVMELEQFGGMGGGPAFLPPGLEAMMDGDVEIQQLGPGIQVMGPLSGLLGGPMGGVDMGPVGGGIEMMPMGGGIQMMGGPIDLGSMDFGLPGVRILAGGSAAGLRGAKVAGAEIPRQALLQAFSGLFDPVSVPLHPHFASGPLPGDMHPLDRFVSEVLGGLGVQAGAMGAPGLLAGPPGCAEDVQAHCPHANATRVFHCLAHVEKLSPVCEKTFRQSLPEVCKAPLGACDLLQEGMLPCLKRQTDLPPDCADGLAATVQSITTVQDGLQQGAVVVHDGSAAERPLVGSDAASYYDQFKTFAEHVLQPHLFEETEA